MCHFDKGTLKELTCIINDITRMKEKLLIRNLSKTKIQGIMRKIN